MSSERQSSVFRVCSILKSFHHLAHLVCQFLAFLLLLCMIVLTEKTSKFQQYIIFWILVFSCHKMTLITKITGMPQVQQESKEIISIIIIITFNHTTKPPSWSSSSPWHLGRVQEEGKDIQHSHHCDLPHHLDIWAECKKRQVERAASLLTALQGPRHRKLHLCRPHSLNTRMGRSTTSI